MLHQTALAADAVCHLYSCADRLPLIICGCVHLLGEADRRLDLLNVSSKSEHVVVAGLGHWSKNGSTHCNTCSWHAMHSIVKCSMGRRAAVGVGGGS